MTILWWHWIVLGLVLVAAEMAAAGGFFIIFFGIAAVIVGILGALDASGPLWLQLLLFSVLSVGFLSVFRQRVLRWFQADPQRPSIDTLVGEIGTASEELNPGSVGQIELRGTTWSARNAADVPLARGTRCRVVRVDGLTLSVEPEGVRS